MEIVDSRNLDWESEFGHREGGIAFRNLFMGEEGQPDNYLFTIAKVDDEYDTPRHRHNFDQVRYMLSGAFNFGPQEQKEGTVGYFAEGTFYEQKARGPSRTLLLQTANASRSRYISQRELKRGIEELRAVGTFKHGVYTRTRKDGKPVNRDGHTAVWEHITRERLHIAKPRYERAVIMEPDNFNYIDLDDRPGVAVKHLGSFTERELRLSFMRLKGGANCLLDGETLGLTLVYAVEGEGKLDGENWTAGCAIRLDPSDRCDLEATKPSVLFVIGMPR